MIVFISIVAAFKVGDFTSKLSDEELKHYISCRVICERFHPEQSTDKSRLKLFGYCLPNKHSYYEGDIYGPW